MTTTRPIQIVNTIDERLTVSGMERGKLSLSVGLGEPNRIGSVEQTIMLTRAQALHLVSAVQKALGA